MKKGKVYTLFPLFITFNRKREKGFEMSVVLRLALLKMDTRIPWSISVVKSQKQQAYSSDPFPPLIVKYCI
jgi:hypothetical protein